MRQNPSSWAVPLGLSIFLGSAALAQSPPAPARAAPAAPAPAEPEQTTATFGDWVVRCDNRGGDRPARRACEMVQTAQDRNGQPVLQLLMGRPAPGGPLRVVALLPVNVTVTQPPRIAVEGQPPVALTLRACGPRGCLADAEVEAATLARLEARAEAASRFEYRDAAGGEVAIPLSLRGFAQARAALDRP